MIPETVEKCGCCHLLEPLLSSWQSHCSVFKVVYFVQNLMCSSISQTMSLLIRRLSPNLAVSFEKKVFSCYKYSQHMSI